MHFASLLGEALRIFKVYFSLKEKTNFATCWYTFSDSALEEIHPVLRDAVFRETGFRAGEVVQRSSFLSPAPTPSGSQLPLTPAPGDWKPSLASKGNTVTWTFLKANLCVFIRQGEPGFASMAEHSPDPVTSNRSLEIPLPLLLALLFPLPLCIAKLLIFTKKPKKPEPRGQSWGDSQGQGNCSCFFKSTFGTRSSLFEDGTMFLN